ncbi:MAG: nucleotidyltransferase family protein, partial [Ardenticatenaceae bacterium]
SKARGDATSESDIDILIVTDSDTWTFRNALFDLGWHISLEYDVLFNLHIIGQDRWEWMRQIRPPLYRAIRAEGIPLPRTPELAGPNV